MSANSSSEFDLLDADTKEWIDARSSWLVDQFGRECIRSCTVVLPTAEFFPDPYTETEEGARAILDRLCKFTGIDPQRTDLSLFSAAERADGGAISLGACEMDGNRFHIWVDMAHLHAPLELTASLARGLGHAHLLEYGRVQGDADDLPPLIDLLTVFLGLGVITSNASLRDMNWQTGGWEGWSISRHSHCTMPMYGYALALFSRVRDEYQPTWPKTLRPDVRHAFQRSLKFFEHHGLPELRSVRTTGARPTIVRTDSAVDAAEQLPPPESEERIVDCIFCGTVLRDQPANEGVCEQCQASIDENKLDLESDRQKSELASRRKRSLSQWGCLVMIVLVVAVIVLEWLEMIQ